TRIEVDEATNYTVTVRDANDCEVTVDITGTSLEQFTDTRDDQVYRVVKIGDQIWLGENLNYITNDDSFCYDDEAANCAEDGRLYTWDAAREAVPAGWKLPARSDINDLIEALGGDDQDAAVAMRMGGSSGWEEQLAGRFGASYGNQDVEGTYWLSNEVNDTEAESVDVDDNIVDLDEADDKAFRHSVRLLKD
ncbi:MAG: FISUMP domain-containing protein, partial [Bacteroidota bacterium]